MTNTKKSTHMESCAHWPQYRSQYAPGSYIGAWATGSLIFKFIRYIIPLHRATGSVLNARWPIGGATLVEPHCQVVLQSTTLQCTTHNTAVYPIQHCSAPHTTLHSGTLNTLLYHTSHFCTTPHCTLQASVPNCKLHICVPH